MFKKEKDLTERSQSLLKNKEIKLLRSEVCLQFSRLTDAELAPLFSKKSNVTATKLANRTILYAVDGVPLLFDKEGRNNLFPTVYFLSIFPQALRCFEVHSHVSRFVLNGADLMLPGVCSTASLEGLLKNEKVTIKITGNPIPFAVGESVTSWTMIQENGLHGKAMNVLHYWNDQLRQYNNTVKTMVPNEGFTAHQIVPTEPAVEGVIDKVSSEEPAESAEHDGSPSHVNEIIASTESPTGNETAGGDSHGDIDNQLSPNLPVDANGFESECDRSIKEDIDTPAPEDNANLNAEAKLELHSTDSSGQIETEEVLGGESETNPTQSMDELIEESVCLALRYILKPNMLPMLVSSFWAIVLRCCPEDKSLNIKKSSFRQVANLIGWLAQEGVLTYTSAPNGNLEINSIQRTHEKIRNASVVDVDAFRASVANASTGTATAAGEGPSSGLFGKHELGDHFSGAGVSIADVATGKLRVIELYKVPRGFCGGLLEGTTGEFGALLRATEVKTALFQRVSSNGWDCPRQRSHVLLPADCSVTRIVSRKHTVAGCDGQQQQPTNQKCNSASEAVENVARDEISHLENSVELHEDNLSNDKRVQTVGGVMVAPISRSSKLSAEMPPASKLPAKTAATWKPVTLSATASDSSIGVSLKGERPQKDQISNDGGSDKVFNVEPILVHKEDLLKAILAKLAPYHAIIDGAGKGRICSGSVPNIELIVESRQGNKVVTRALGLEKYPIDLEKFAKDCQKKFACSCAVQPNKEVVIQGHLSDELSCLLIEQLELPRNVVVAKIMKNVKAKKKR